MTSLSSGDRPAEETCTCGHGRLLHTVRGCGMCRCRRFRPATPPAVRTGDDAATVERDEDGLTPTEQHVARLIWEGVKRQYAPTALDRGAMDGFEPRTLARAALTALSTPSPVSGAATRDDVARWVEQVRWEWGQEAQRAGCADWRDLSSGTLLHIAHQHEVAAPRKDRPSMTDLRYELSARIVQHIADQEDMTPDEYGQVYDAEKHERLMTDLMRLLALGGSQPAQPAEEQRPIDVLAEQWDDGLQQRIEALAEEWDREQAALGFVLRPIARLRRALDGDGGNRG